MKKLIIIALLVSIPMNAASAMDLATFLAKKNSVMSKGPFGLLSGDYKLLTAELTNSNKALRAERLAAPAAGRKPAYCPVPKSDIPPSALFAALEAIPAAQRPQIQVQDALRIVYARKWPCPN